MHNRLNRWSRESRQWKIHGEGQINFQLGRVGTDRYEVVHALHRGTFIRSVWRIMGKDDLLLMGELHPLSELRFYLQT